MIHEEEQQTKPSIINTDSLKKDVKSVSNKRNAIHKRMTLKCKSTNGNSPGFFSILICLPIKARREEKIVRILIEIFYDIEQNLVRNRSLKLLSYTQAVIRFRASCSVDCREK